MNFFTRLLANLSGLLKGKPGKPAPKEASRKPLGSDPREYLMGVAPGLWSSNHLNEAARCEGWQFVAVRSLSRMCSQAELQVHEVGSSETRGRQIKQAIRFNRLCADFKRMRYWKGRLARLKAESTRVSTRSDRSPVDPEDDLLRFLQRPNPEWSLVTNLFATVQQFALTGTCYDWLVSNELGTPAEMFVLPTGLLQPRMPSAPFPKGSYYLTPLSSFGLSSQGAEWAPGTLGTALLTGCELDARDIKPVRWPHPLYMSDGLSPLSAIKLWVDVSNEMDRACWYALQNQERPGMIFELDPSVNPAEDDVTQFREDLKAEHAGTPNTGRHLVLPKGVKARDRARTPTEQDYAQGRPAYRDMNLAAHAMSPIACGIVEAGSYSSFWAAIKQTTELSVQPTLDLIAGEWTELLGMRFEGPRREITLTARGIDDPQLLEQRLRTDILAGNAVTVDEYRALRGYPPLGYPDGEQFVGMRRLVRQVDGDAEKPGVQNEETENQDNEKNPESDDTGGRRADRDAAPGRSDMGGKQHRENGSSRNGRNGTHTTHGPSKRW